MTMLVHAVATGGLILTLERVIRPGTPLEVQPAKKAIWKNVDAYWIDFRGAAVSRILV